MTALGLLLSLLLLLPMLSVKSCDRRMARSLATPLKSYKLSWGSIALSISVQVQPRRAFLERKVFRLLKLHFPSRGNQSWATALGKLQYHHLPKVDHFLVMLWRLSFIIDDRGTNWVVAKKIHVLSTSALSPNSTNNTRKNDFLMKGSDCIRGDNSH